MLQREVVKNQFTCSVGVLRALNEYQFCSALYHLSLH